MGGEESEGVKRNYIAQNYDREIRMFASVQLVALHTIFTTKRNI